VFVEMASFTIQPDDIRSGQKAAKIRTLAKQGATQGERMAAQSKTKGPSMPKVKAGDKSIRDIHAEYQPSLAELVLGEEMCGKGHYWCNTDKQCKKVPSGFKIDGQPSGSKRTEVGIGKPVAEENACNHSKKGKKCPIHGMEDCAMKEEKDPKGPVKKYKSPKEIATKHNVSVEEIKKQLDDGH